MQNNNQFMDMGNHQELPMHILDIASAAVIHKTTWENWHHLLNFNVLSNSTTANLLSKKWVHMSTKRH